MSSDFAENVWVMTRERLPSGPVLQRAYGVLDRYKISRTFFVKTDQDNCETRGEAEEVDEVNNSGYDIVVDDEEVLNEYYNGPSASNGGGGYYRQNQPLGKTDADKTTASDISVPATTEAITSTDNVKVVDPVAVPASTAQTPDRQTDATKLT